MTDKYNLKLQQVKYLDSEGSERIRCVHYESKHTSVEYYRDIYFVGHDFLRLLYTRYLTGVSTTGRH